MQQSLAEKKSESVYKAVEEAQKEKEKAKRFKSPIQMFAYYALPIASIGVFLGVLLFGTIPSIKGIINWNKLLGEKKEEIKDLDKQIASLKDLKARESEIDSDLAIIDKIVPSEKTQVAKFVGEIDELAQTHNLEESSYESGEQIEELEENVEEQSKKETATIIHIPTTSEYISPFENIKNFLNALYQKKDFIIVSLLEMQGHSAREYLAAIQQQEGQAVTVNTSLSQDSWTMGVTFEKYQFSKGFNQYISENFVSVESEPDEKTLQYIRNRFSE